MMYPATTIGPQFDMNHPEVARLFHDQMDKWYADRGLPNPHPRTGIADIAPASLAAPATMGPSAPPQFTGQWWTDPTKLAQAGSTLAPVSTAPPADAHTLDAIQTSQVQQLLDRINADNEKQLSGISGRLGGTNMMSSGLGVSALGEQINNATRNKNEAATNLAAVLAANDLEASKFNAQHELDVANLRQQGAIAAGRLGLDTRQLDDNKLIQLGQLSLESQKVQNQSTQFNQQLALDRSVADTNRQVALGNLQNDQQRIANQNTQFYAAQDAQSLQANLDRAFQIGMKSIEEQFQSGQSALAREHEMEMERLRASDAQLAQVLDQQFKAGQAAADRGLQQQTINNQLTLGQGDLALRGRALDQQSQTQNMDTAMKFLTLVGSGLNPGSPLVAPIAQQLGFNTGGTGPGSGAAPPMDWTTFAQQHGVPLYALQGPVQVGSSVDAKIQQVRQMYDAYLQQVTPLPAFNRPLTMSGGGIIGANGGFTSFGGVLDAGGNKTFDKYGQPVMNVGGGFNPALAPNTSKAITDSLPPTGKVVYDALVNGKIPNVSSHDLNYWLPQIQLLLPNGDQAVNQLGLQMQNMGTPRVQSKPNTGYMGPLRPGQIG